jgi:hypothetical protein
MPHTACRDAGDAACHCGLDPQSKTACEPSPAGSRVEPGIHPQTPMLQTACGRAGARMGGGCLRWPAGRAAWLREPQAHRARRTCSDSRMLIERSVWSRSGQTRSEFSRGPARPVIAGLPARLRAGHPPSAPQPARARICSHPRRRLRPGRAGPFAQSLDPRHFPVRGRPHHPLVPPADRWHNSHRNKGPSPQSHPPTGKAVSRKVSQPAEAPCRGAESSETDE